MRNLSASGGRFSGLAGPPYCPSRLVPFSSLQPYERTTGIARRRYETPFGTFPVPRPRSRLVYLRSVPLLFPSLLAPSLTWHVRPPKERDLSLSD